MSEVRTRPEEDREGTVDSADGEGSAESMESPGSEETERSSGDRDAAGEGPSKNDSQDVEETDRTTVLEEKATYTPRFAGFVVLFSVLTITGILTFNPAAIAAAGTLLVFLTASIIHTPVAAADKLTVNYTVTPEHPRPADHATVTITVTNTSETTLTDIRLIDDVPRELQVTNGSPRAAQALRPGDSLTIEYQVVATRGAYTFGPLIARTRTLMGTMWVQEPITPETPAELQCAVRADDIPLEEQATHYIGRLLGDTGGDGIEFHSTREYHRGDSPSQINWRELAKRGELSTVTYREQQSARITILTDARMWARVNSGAGTTSAAVLGAYAAYQLTMSLTNQGHYVGMVAPGIQPRDIEQEAGSPFPYRRFNHGNGMDQQQQAFELLEEIETAVNNGTYTGDDTLQLRDPGTGSFRTGRTGTEPFDINPFKVSVNSFVKTLTTWTGDTTQFIFITPLLDDGSHGLCTQLHRMGYPVIIISPDITGTPGYTASDSPSETTVSERALTVQRATRIESLRHDGLTVIDWSPDTPLATACEQQTLPGTR